MNNKNTKPKIWNVNVSKMKKEDAERYIKILMARYRNRNKIKFQTCRIESI